MARDNRKVRSWEKTGGLKRVRHPDSVGESTCWRSYRWFVWIWLGNCESIYNPSDCSEKRSGGVLLNSGRETHKGITKHMYNNTVNRVIHYKRTDIRFGRRRLPSPTKLSRTIKRLWLSRIMCYHELSTHNLLLTLITSRNVHLTRFISRYKHHLRTHRFH